MSHSNWRRNNALQIFVPLSDLFGPSLDVTSKKTLILQVCAVLKGRMMQAGTIMVGYQPDDRRPNFFRNIISSAAVTERDVDFLLAEFDRLGHDIVV